MVTGPTSDFTQKHQQTTNEPRTRANVQSGSSTHKTPNPEQQKATQKNAEAVFKKASPTTSTLKNPSFSIGNRSGAKILDTASNDPAQSTSKSTRTAKSTDKTKNSVFKLFGIKRSHSSDEIADKSQGSSPPAPPPSPTSNKSIDLSSKNDPFAQVANMAANSGEDKQNIAKALQKLVGTKADETPDDSALAKSCDSLKLTQSKETRAQIIQESKSSLSEICQKLSGTGENRDVLLSSLLVKLDVIGTFSATSGYSISERNSLVECLSKAIGTDTAQELVLHAFKNEATQLLESKGSYDQRWRSGITPAVGLYKGLVTAVMPGLKTDGQAIQSKMETIKKITTGAPFIDNRATIEEVGTAISNDLKKFPSDLAKLNSSLDSVLTNFFTEAEKKGYRVDLAPAQQSKQQIKGFLFLRVIVGNITEASATAGIQSEGVQATKYLQYAANNMQTSSKLDPTEQAFVGKLQTQLQKLDSHIFESSWKSPIPQAAQAGNLTIGRSRPPSPSRSESPPVESARENKETPKIVSRPPPPPFEAPSPPLGAAISKRLDKLSEQIGAAKNSTDLKEINASLKKLMDNEKFTNFVYKQGNEALEEKFNEVVENLENKTEALKRKGASPPESPRDVNDIE